MLMTRLINIVILVMLFTSIYTTFSVKDDVAILAKKVALLKDDIRIEQEKITIYKTEWATLTGIANIESLKNKLIPELQIVSVEQMENIDDNPVKTQLVQNLQSNISF
jgi:hypothetical protein